MSLLFLWRREMVDMDPAECQTLFGAATGSSSTANIIKVNLISRTSPPPPPPPFVLSFNFRNKPTT
jgi:hypothetical protein